MYSETLTNDEYLKEQYKEILQTYSQNGIINYSFAIWLGVRILGLDSKTIRKMLVDLHAEGYWDWDNKWRMKIIGDGHVFS